MQDNDYTVYVLSSRSGRQIAEFGIDDDIQAENIADTLMQSPSWASCYVVCIDRFGDRRFVKEHSTGSTDRIQHHVMAEAVPDLPYEGMSGEESGVFQIVNEE